MACMNDVKQYLLALTYSNNNKQNKNNSTMKLELAYSHRKINIEVLAF